MTHRIVRAFPLCLLLAGTFFAQSRYDETVASARSLIAQKDYQKAAAQSQQAIELDEKRWEAYVAAASAYSGQKLYDDAIGMLQLALVRAPEDRKQLIRDAIADARRQLGGGSSTAAPEQPTQAEIVLWKTIENSKSAGDFAAYLTRYPNGAFTPLATARLATLKDEQAAADAKAKEVETQKRQEWATIAKGGKTYRVVRVDKVSSNGRWEGLANAELTISGRGVSFVQKERRSESFEMSCTAMPTSKELTVKVWKFGEALQWALTLKGQDFVFLDGVQAQAVFDLIVGVCAVATGK